MIDTLALWIWLAGVAAAGTVAFLVSARKTRGDLFGTHLKDPKRKLDH